PAQRTCEERQAEADQRPPAHAVGERTGEWRHEDRRDRPGQGAQAGLERGVSLRRLQELRQKEDRAEEAEEEEQRGAVRGAEGTIAEEAHGRHRGRCPKLPEHESGEQDRAERQRGQDLGGGPAGAVAANEPPDEAEEPRARERESWRVETRGGAEALRKS